MDCFQDFCLNCDRQASSGLYCSQSCRLADLEKASAPSSPVLSNHSSSTTRQQQQYQPSWASSSGFGSGSGYIITSTPKTEEWTRTYTQPSASEERSPQSSYFMRTPAKEARPASQGTQRSLTPSSSRSSLASNTSGSNPNAISEQARQELQEYFSAFDQAKASKRRQSTW
ncbi:uncharacterized protein LTR77_004558 [Saxophila tyrrhenica]|uniref:Uncharacterized protein n=1 Tax=Saxophila tyrrhenica TaxID=1690608 RepID=A0AAV9PFM4_9PEZI|nr:hypothetical protein LTR77_004558 [Saxophila tyrrhenica]